MQQARFHTKRQVFKSLVALWNEGKLYDRSDTHRRLRGVFNGSADRYSAIALRLQGQEKVLDVGCGSGMLLAVLANLGHQCWGLDLNDPAKLPSTFRHPQISYSVCNVEVDPYPFPDGFFDAVTCCQTLEHFSHSPLPAMAEMKRVLKTGGIIELDVPNVACMRNRLRMLRGKHVLWDYKKHYLEAKPLLYNGRSFYPGRHNREFTRDELALLLTESGFVSVEVSFFKDENYRTGWGKVRSAGSAVRNVVPGLRKSLMAFARKP